MKRVKIHGLGGQGVITAAKILASVAAIYEDKFVKIFPAHGHERRGSPVFVDVYLDNTNILLNTFIYVPDIVIVLEPYTDICGNVPSGKPSTSILIVNSDDVSVLNDYKEKYGFEVIYYVNASKIALKHTGNNIPNIALFGGIAKAGVVNIDFVIKAVADNKIITKYSCMKSIDAVREAYEKTAIF